jgi:sulfide dehydrogenase cytochrome subunit
MIGRKSMQRRTRGPDRWVQLGAFILAIAPLSSVPAQDLNAEGLADACTSCHGTGGRSRGYIPSIGGVKKEALLQQLKSFRAQAARATIMNRIARAYTDPELDVLAAYFSSASRP